MDAKSSGGSSVKSSNGGGSSAARGGSSGQARTSGVIDASYLVEDSHKDLNYHAYTLIKTIKCNYLWTISNYTFVKDKDESIKSPKFTTPDGTEWYLRVHPLGFNRDVPERNFVSAYLCVYQPNNGHVQAKHRGKILSFDDETNDALKTMERSAKMGKVDCFTRDNFSWGWPEFISHNDLFDEEKKFLSSDSIRILWYLEILVEVENNCHRIDFPCSTLSEDFGDLYKTGRWTDVCVRCGDGREFRVHKLVLGTRSKYFEAMFSHPTKENNKAVVDLPDNGDVIDLLFEYMYTDKITNAETMMEGLLEVADKYQIDNLRRICESKLIERINVDNVTGYFVHSSKFNAELLKKECKSFIAANIRQVTKTTGWSELNNHDEGFALATELLDMQAGREAESGHESMA